MRSVRGILGALCAWACLGVLDGCGGSSRSVATLSAAPRAAASARSSSLQQQFVAVIARVAPTVVQISTSRGLGSGVVCNDRGDVITNAHVVTGARRISVTLASGSQHPATLVGIYPENDIAVIHITDATPNPATFADSSRIQVGDIVLAIGNPLGLRSSVTQGIVSSVGRTVSEGNGVVLPSVIQTSAEINPGNSGGALVDLSGAVIGIPTLAALDPEFGSAPAPGIGFAIPSNTAENFAHKLIASGRVAPTARAFLGVSASSLASGGVLVVSIEPGGPAARAGIKPGDVIVSLAGQSTPTTDVLVNVLATLRPDQTVPVQVLSQRGQPSTLQVTLSSQPGP